MKAKAQEPRPKRKRGGPGYKGTVIEIEERVEFVSALIAKHYRFSQIKNEVRAKFRDLSGRQIAEYVSRAEKNALDHANTSKPDLIARSLLFNESVIQSKKSTIDQKQ